MGKDSAMEELKVKVMMPLVNLVERSFKDWKSDTPIPRHLVSERVDFTVKMAKILRFDLRWSFPKIIDRMPRLLDNWIKGIPIDLDKERSSGLWVPGEKIEREESYGFGS